jgi:WD40 repeat protein
VKFETDGDSPYCLCFSPEGKFVAAGCNDGFIRFFSPDKGSGELLQHKTEGNLLDVAWSRNADKVAFTTGCKKVGVLHLKRT